MTISKKMESQRETHTHLTFHGDLNQDGIPQREKTHTPKLMMISEMESLSQSTKSSCHL